MRTYSIVVDPDPEGGYTVTVPALPGCITQGETTEECIVEPIPEEREHPQLLQVTVAA
jgi:hypothetical protein